MAAAHLPMESYSPRPPHQPSSRITKTAPPVTGRLRGADTMFRYTASPSAPISQMVKLRLDDGEGLGPDLTAQKWRRGDLKLSRPSRGQKPPHFGVPSLLKACFPW